MYKMKNVGAVWIVVTSELHLKIHTQASNIVNILLVVDKVVILIYF